MSTVKLNPLGPGVAFVRSLISYVASGGDLARAAEHADIHFRSTPHVKAFFERGGFYRQAEQWSSRHKSAVGGYSIDDLSPLGFSSDAFALLQSVSIFGRLAPACNRVPFRTLTPREYGAGAGGAWRGEGLPRPVALTAVDQLQQLVYEATVCIVVSKEWMRPNAIYERALLRMIGNALAKYVDGQLLDPAVSASTEHPASITNGATVVSSTGSSAAQIAADLASLIAAIESPADGLRWIMRSKTYAYINAKLASAGLPPTPGFLLGIPVITGSTSPSQVALVDAASIAVSYDEAIVTDISTVTSLEMDTSPTQDGLAGGGAQLVSLMQAGLVAMQQSMNVAWQPSAVMPSSPAQPAGVAYMTVTY